MIKLIIGFIALLILLAASYIIFVDNTPNQSITHQIKENFQVSEYNHQERMREICQNFKNNPRSFIEDNSNFEHYHFEPNDINEKMKVRYNLMYNQCYILNQNLEDSDICSNKNIGPIPTKFTGDFAQKMINCISNDTCDVLKTTNECIRRGDDCNNHSSLTCEETPHCIYHDNFCQFKQDACYRHNDQTTCNNDDYCNFNIGSNQCLQRYCSDNYDRESCESDSSCRWDGNICHMNMNMTTCREIPVNQCTNDSRCILVPINEPQALCVPSSN